jgi:hypothetical protein
MEDINDIRYQKDFNGKSFSKFKRNDVIKEFIKCILNNKIESACNWSAELICAGHYITLWDTILLVMSKYIHLGNPKLPIYLLMRFNQFKEIVANGYVGNELMMRNNTAIRTLFGEIVVVLCLSNKRPGFEAIKINKANEFNISQMSNKFKAPNVNYGREIFRENDPKEIYIAINEFVYQIQNKNNVLECCYWVEWLIEFDSLCRRKKEPLECEPRTFSPVDTKYQKDCIWIIWEILIHETDHPLQKKIVSTLMDLFSLKYNYSIKKKRKFILYFAIELITQQPNFQIDIINATTTSTIERVLKNLHKVYKNIIKNQIAPNTDYLFQETKTKSNLEKTIQKLDMMKKLNAM